MNSHPSLTATGRAGAGLFVKETVLLLALAVVLPVVVHLIPAAGNAAWGARLLAMFYAPLLGVLFFRLHVGLLPALLAPALNTLLTGMPGGLMTGLLTVELTVFTLLTYALLHRWPRFGGAAPAAYVLTKGVSAALITVLPFLAAFRPGAAFAANAVLVAAPGLVVLLALNTWAVRRTPREDAPPDGGS